MTAVVPAVMAEAKDVEAARTFVFVVETFVLTVAKVEPRLVDAAKTVESVCPLIEVTALETWLFVFVLTPAILAPNEVEARSVCALTAVVPAEIAEASDVEAFNTFVLAVLIFVLAVLTLVPIVAKVAPSEVEAISVCALTAV